MTKTDRARQYLVMTESDRPSGPGLEAFDAVYEREFDYIWRTLGRLGVPPADLPDVAHEVFVVVFRRWTEIDPDRPIRPWLFGIARKLAAQVRRKRAEVLDAEIAEAPARVEAAFADRDLLWRALARVDDERRPVVVLHDLEGYTGADIAAMLDIPVNTVHSRLRVGRSELVEALRRLRGAP